MGLFKRNEPVAMQTSERQLLLNKYTSARTNILVIVALTVINIVLLVTNSNTYFLFSAFFPYLLADFAMFFCGMYPAEVYAGGLETMQFYGKGFFVVMMGLAVLILVLYLLSWVFSKKNAAWMIFALVFFSVDTLAMLVLNGFMLENLIDYLIHALVIFSLAKGVSSYNKLKKLPAESETVEEIVQQGPEIDPVS